LKHGNLPVFPKVKNRGFAGFSKSEKSGKYRFSKMEEKPGFFGFSKMEEKPGFFGFSKMEEKPGFFGFSEINMYI